MTLYEKVLYVLTVVAFLLAFGWYMQILNERDRILVKYGDCALSFARENQIPFTESAWKAAWGKCGDIDK